MKINMSQVVRYSSKSTTCMKYTYIYSFILQWRAPCNNYWYDYAWCPMFYHNRLSNQVVIDCTFSI